MIISRRDGWFSALDFGPNVQSEIKKFWRSLSNSEKRSLGFIPDTQLDRLVQHGQLAVLVVAGDLVGFVVFSARNLELKIFQVCVRNDCRRIVFGSALVSGAIDFSMRKQILWASCWCAHDLDAIVFWQAIGFKKTAERFKSKRTIRRQVQFKMFLPATQHFESLLARKVFNPLLFS